MDVQSNQQLSRPPLAAARTHYPYVCSPPGGSVGHLRYVPTLSPVVAACMYCPQTKNASSQWPKICPSIFTSTVREREPARQQGTLSLYLALELSDCDCTNCLRSTATVYSLELLIVLYRVERARTTTAQSNENLPSIAVG